MLFRKMSQILILLRVISGKRVSLIQDLGDFRGGHVEGRTIAESAQNFQALSTGHKSRWKFKLAFVWVTSLLHSD